MNLLAHELTHVIQQSGHAGLRDSGLKIGPSDDAHERQAEFVAAAVTGDSTKETGMYDARPEGLILQRQATEDSTLTGAGDATPLSTGDCSVYEKNPKALAYHLAHFHYDKEVQGSGIATAFDCSSPDMCKMTFEDGTEVTVMTVEMPVKASAGATMPGGKVGKLCDYSYRCQLKPPAIFFKQISCS